MLIISLFSPCNIHVCRESCVFMEDGPVVEVGRNALGLLGLTDIHHVQRNTVGIFNFNKWINGMQHRFQLIKEDPRGISSVFSGILLDVWRI